MECEDVEGSEGDEKVYNNFIVCCFREITKLIFKTPINLINLKRKIPIDIPQYQVQKSCGYLEKTVNLL